MNLGQLIGMLMRKADVGHWSECIEPPGMRPAPVERVARQHGPKGGRWALVVAALRGKELSAKELHAAVGGSAGALSVMLSVRCKAGELQTVGERGSYRYRLPE